MLALSRVLSIENHSYTHSVLFLRLYSEGDCPVSFLNAVLKLVYVAYPTASAISDMFRSVFLSISIDAAMRASLSFSRNVFPYSFLSNLSVCLSLRLIFPASSSSVSVLYSLRNHSSIILAERPASFSLSDSVLSLSIILPRPISMSSRYDFIAFS